MKRTWTKAMTTVALTAGMLMTSVSAGFAGVSGRGITPYTADTTQTSGTFMELQDYMSKDISNLSAIQLQQLQNYFADSIIVGDSIAQNFDYYNVANGKGDVVSDNFKSASAAAYTVSAALMPVDGVTAHPMIRGQRMRIPDAVKAFGSKHVYSFFGWKSVPDPNAADEYEQLLREIQRENPGVEVTVISATYMCKGFQTAENNNDMVRAYNEKMKQKCRVNGWGYLDVAPFMNDGQGNLPDEMSVDKQIHYKYPYYSLWVELMKKYALARSGY